MLAVGRSMHITDTLLSEFDTHRKQYNQNPVLCNKTEYAVNALCKYLVPTVHDRQHIEINSCSTYFLIYFVKQFIVIKYLSNKYQDDAKINYCRATILWFVFVTQQYSIKFVDHCFLYHAVLKKNVLSMTVFFQFLYSWFIHHKSTWISNYY